MTPHRRWLRHLNADGTRGAGDGGIDQARGVVLLRGGDASGQLVFESNGDGKLTAAWSEFRVWQDADQDGVTDAGELKTLDEMGFTRIGLTYDDGSSYAQTSDDVIIQGAALLGASGSVSDHWKADMPDRRSDGGYTRAWTEQRFNAHWKV